MSNNIANDYKVKVFNQKEKRNTIVPKSTNTINSQQKAIITDDGLVPQLKTASTSLRTQIQQARQKKKLTQKQLATKCNLPLSVINKYENGTAVINQMELNKMRRVLGAPLSTK